MPLRLPLFLFGWIYDHALQQQLAEIQNSTEQEHLWILEFPGLLWTAVIVLLYCGKRLALALALVLVLLLVLVLALVLALVLMLLWNRHCSISAGFGAFLRLASLDLEQLEQPAAANLVRPSRHQLQRQSRQ
jgi:sensor histidine kinase YesM